MSIVQVFKTNIPDTMAAGNILADLRQTLPNCHINFDLNDCDRIFRIESKRFHIADTYIQLLFEDYGYQCEPLGD
jgi:hypothetical protein